MEKTLHEAFEELIKNRLWYKNSTRTPTQAKADKSRFKKNIHVPEDRIREYLAAAGWVVKQEEKWIKF